MCLCLYDSSEWAKRFLSVWNDTLKWLNEWEFGTLGIDRDFATELHVFP